MPQKEKQMEKTEKKGCADAITVVLVYVLVCLCCIALSRFVNTPRNGQRQHHQQHIYEGFGGLLHPLALFRPLLVPPPRVLCFLLFLIPSPVRQDGSDEGLQVALNPFRSKMHRALGTSRKGWNESLNLFKRR